MKSAKKILALVLCVVMAVSLAACGKKNNQKDGLIDQDKDSEYVYVPEYINLPSTEENSWYNNMQLIGGSIYYDLYSYSEDTGKSTESIMKYSLADGETKELLSQTGEGSINYFRLDQEGNIYVTYTIWGEYDEATGESDCQYFLRKYTTDGNMAYEQDFTDIMLQNFRATGWNWLSGQR